MIKEIVKICGLDKEEILSRLEKFEGFGVNFSVEEYCLDATIGMSSSAKRDVFETVKSRVYNAFEEEVYSATEGSLEEIAARLLKMNNRTLAVGESLTGGEICSRLTGIPGISANFYEGIVCYNRTSKVERLGVPKSVLADYGAVSRETAYAMVKGLCNVRWTSHLQPQVSQDRRAMKESPWGLCISAWAEEISSPCSSADFREAATR